MEAQKVLCNNGYKQSKKFPDQYDMFIKEWDECHSTQRTDTTIGIRVLNGQIIRARFFTDKFASITGSYYTGKVEFPEGTECTPELLVKLEHCIAQLALGSHKELKEQFNAVPKYVPMS